MSDASPSDKLDFPATQRNRGVILEVLRSVLPAQGTVVEIASGSGQHTAAFAPAFPGLTFQPTDPVPEHRASIAAWTHGIPNVQPPLALDVLERWPVATCAALLCINMIHIAPWACTVALVEGAARCLASGSPLFLYGPFRVSGRHTAPSNAAFDRSLKERDPTWGVRDLEAVVAEAKGSGFAHERTVEMPANNLSVVFRKG